MFESPQKSYVSSSREIVDLKPRIPCNPAFPRGPPLQHKCPFFPGFPVLWVVPYPFGFFFHAKHLCAYWQRLKQLSNLFAPPNSIELPFGVPRNDIIPCIACPKFEVLILLLLTPPLSSTGVPGLIGSPRSCGPVIDRPWGTPEPDPLRTSRPPWRVSEGPTHPAVGGWPSMWFLFMPLGLLKESRFMLYFFTNLPYGSSRYPHPPP